jgi:hypothetical protein
MTINSQDQKKIIHILTDIFPGVLIYYYGNKEKSYDAEGKKPEIDIALDLGRIIGTKDIAEAQRALSETKIPYTIYLYDLNGVSEHERKAIIARATAWKL